MLTGILWRFLFLHTFVMGSFYSNCQLGHLQETFCACQLVFTGEIIRPVKYEGPFKFRILMLLRAKALEFTVAAGDVINVEKNKQLETQMDLLRIENEFVVFAFYYNGKFYAEQCRPIEPLSLLTSFQKNALQYYNQGCPCMDESGKKIGNPVCLSELTYFVQVERDCIWIKSPLFDRCNQLD